MRWMVESHARLAGDIARTEKLIAVLQADLDRLRELQSSLAMSARFFDSSIDPSKLPKLNGWKGRYGKRGALKKAVLAVLQEAHPEPLRTVEIAVQVINRLGLAIEGRRAVSMWIDASLRKVLQRGVAEGDIERLHDALDAAGMGRWQLAARAVPSMAITTTR